MAESSIRSKVNLKDPKLHRGLRLKRNHFSIVNDIASYEKDKRRFETGGREKNDQCHPLNGEGRTHGSGDGKVHGICVATLY